MANTSPEGSGTVRTRDGSHTRERGVGALFLGSPPLFCCHSPGRFIDCCSCVKTGLPQGTVLSPRYIILATAE